MLILSSPRDFLTPLSDVMMNITKKKPRATKKVVGIKLGVHVEPDLPRAGDKRGLNKLLITAKFLNQW